MLFFDWLSCCYSTAEHPLSKLLAECQYNVCESMKPLAVATASCGNFPSVTILPVSRHPDDPLPSVRTPSGDRTGSISSSVSSSVVERSRSVPDVSNNMTMSLHKLHLSQSVPPPSGSHDDTSEVFMSPPAATDLTETSEDANGIVTGSEPSQVEDSQQGTAAEATANGEALYFVLEKPPNRDEKPTNRLASVGSPSDKPATADTPSYSTGTPSDKLSTPMDKPSTPGYEEIDETVVEKGRPPSPLPYELPSLSRQDSYDPYYSNIGSPETSGYTLLSQWTRSIPESDYTQLDPSTVISKTSSAAGAAATTMSYPLLNCSVHLGKKDILETLSEKVSLSIKVIVKEIHLCLSECVVCVYVCMCMCQAIIVRWA